MKLTAAAISLFALTTAASAQDDPGMMAAMETITADGIRADIETLASPAFEGRAPGGIGEEMTVNFIAGQFAEVGISPGIDGSFMQPFALAEFRWSIAPRAAREFQSSSTEASDPSSTSLPPSLSMPVGAFSRCTMQLNASS